MKHYVPPPPPPEQYDVGMNPFVFLLVAVVTFVLIVTLALVLVKGG